MDRQLAGRTARAFGLGRAVGELRPYTYSSQRTWTLDTVDGRVLIKSVAWAPERAMSLERRAAAAGIAMPRPVGGVADVDGIGLVRAYEWVDGRALAAEDDVAEWLGDTLARLHRIAPLTRAEPEWYGLFPARQWVAWAAEGVRQRRAWAPVLSSRLGAVTSLSERIEHAFRSAGDYVDTHRDVEPWNVMLTAAGPVLVDWDTAGPDSAGLETAHAAVVFAMRGGGAPDVDAVRRTLVAYGQGGGRWQPSGFVLARRAGMRLNRLAERLRVTLGEQEPGPIDPGPAEARAAEQLAELPAFVALLEDWSARLSAGTDRAAPPTAAT